MGIGGGGLQDLVDGTGQSRRAQEEMEERLRGIPGHTSRVQLAQVSQDT